MLRREGNLITFDNPQALEQQTGWALPDRLTPAQAVETGSAMLDDASQRAMHNLAARVEGQPPDPEEQQRVSKLLKLAQFIFAACPLERQQFLVEQWSRRNEATE